MREIKFRAWDYDNEEMYQDDMIIIHGGTVFIGKIKYVNQISQDTELMQYTGLKDKNGVEIYKGDIVTTKYDREQKIEENLEICKNRSIMFHKGSFAMEYGVDDFDYLSETVETYEIEVIGNIYENKELIEGLRGK